MIFDPNSPKLKGSEPGELSWLDRQRIRVKWLGMVLTPFFYQVCQQILASAGVVKQYTGPIAWIIVGGIAGAVVSQYESKFLRNSWTPGFRGRGVRISPPPGDPGEFNPPPV